MPTDRRVSRAVALGLLALAAVVVAASSARGGGHVDLEVYVRAGRRWLAGMDPYAARPELPFTYPPFAVLLSVPMALAPGVALAVLTTLTLVAAAGGALSAARDAGRPSLAGHGPPARLSPRQDSGRVRLAWVAVGAGALLSEPVRRTLHLGQVNGLVVGLVLVDLLLVPRPWRGWLTGVAAGTKLTPLVFVLHPLARRDWATAVRIVAGFAATVLVGALVLPAESRTYWTSLALDPGRVGAPGFADNQSLLGLFDRVVPGHATAAWLAASVLAVGAGLVALQRRRGRAPIEGVVVCALLGLLLSPISWSHHWLLLPAAAVVCLRDRRPLVAAIAGATVLLAEPLASSGAVGGSGLLEGLATNAITIAGVLCLVTLARVPGRPIIEAPPGGGPTARGRGPARLPLRPARVGRRRLIPAFPNGTQVRGVARGYEGSRRQETMTKHISHLQEDGTVFPPVTPDPPLPPGQPEIVVPEMVPPKDTATPTRPTEDPKPTEQPD
ncbi:glycosyltransferase 87 family protein [Intrasporangium oryzae]|uniref:glycosyltransferase 87 family protein n=1 Tax=Intrasporangium oryzae TaxID=412687 RepID=UPI00146F9FCD|nr:glycosyltransferase 87 family protein [Intrasporangium oryzae]